MIRVAVNGAAGRMGRTLIEAIGESEELALTAAFEHPDSDAVGSETDGVRIGADVAAGVADFDVLIDFTEPGATLEALGPCEAHGRGLVIGTTGFDAAGLDRIRAAANRVPVLMAPNMSVGVNVTFQLIEMAARALGDDVDVEVYEAHHRHKIDAPSGTAVRMGEILADTLGRELSTDAVYGRVGITGARDARTIGFHSVRGGDIVGEHTVVFAGAGERIEITHRAQSRMNFAMGALRAVRFVAGRERGLYGMADVLGEDIPGQ